MGPNVAGGFHKRWARQTFSARQVARQLREDVKLARARTTSAPSRFPPVPITDLGELAADGGATFVLQLETAQRFRVTVKAVDARSPIGRQAKVSEFCGCCGRPISGGGEWCMDCQSHLAPDDGRPPWERTYYAQHAQQCPYSQ